MCSILAKAKDKISNKISTAESKIIDFDLTLTHRHV